jgi:hypothetical protein
VGAIKALFKLSLLLVVGAVVAGVVFLVKRPADESSISYEEWPNVPHNPDA